MAKKNNVWTRFDQQVYPLQDELYLSTYWKLSSYENGKEQLNKDGLKFLTSLAISHRNVEVVKFDVGFGNESHYHHAPGYLGERMFTGTHVIEQVKQIRALLTSNLQQYLLDFPISEVKNIVLDSESMSTIEDAIKSGCKDILRYCVNRDNLIAKVQSQIS